MDELWGLDSTAFRALLRFWSLGICERTDIGRVCPVLWLKETHVYNEWQANAQQQFLQKRKYLCPTAVESYCTC